MIERHLPVSYTIVNLPALQSLIATLYRWTNVRCQLIKGTMRDVYEVWADEHHAIFCLYRHGERSANEIDAELRIMAHLHEQGISVPQPIPLPNGDLLFSLLQPEGMRYAVMITFMPGKPIGREFSVEVGKMTGYFLASVHNILKTFTTTFNRSRLDLPTALTTAINAFQEAAPQRQADANQLRMAGDIFLQQINLTFDTASYGLLHGDIIPSNILLNGDYLTLIDFDLCAYGWQVYDVATLLVEIAYWGMGIAVKEAFLEGYQTRRSLTEAEYAALPALQGLRCLLSLGTPARYINTWGRGYFSDVIIDKQLALIAQMMD